MSKTYTLIGPLNTKEITIEDDEMIEIMVVKVKDCVIDDSKVICNKK